MTTTASDLAARAARLFLLSFAPNTLPLDVRSNSGLHASENAAAIFLAGAGIAVSVTLWRRSRVAATAFPIAIAAAWACAAVFHGDSGPLARGIWFVAPLEWLALAAATHALVSRTSTFTRRLAVAGIALVAFTSFAVAWPKIRSRDAMWTAALAQDPANESAALAVSASLTRAHHPTEAASTLAHCAASNPSACRCTMSAAAAILVSRIADAVRVLDASPPACRAEPGFVGLQADAWVRAGRVADGQLLAETALARNPRDLHALYASASAFYAKGNHAMAIRMAERADAAGYGDDATMLIGLIDLAANDPTRAAVSFQRVHEHQPNDAAAVYDLALSADRLGRYHDAREGYLAALRIDPRLTDARYNLALLNYRAGAFDEARHDLEQLEQIAPGDPRIPALRQTLGTR